jgi:DNA-binding response OmpR family regulator
VSTSHILVVDDDPTVAEVVARYLLHAGYTVERAADGRAALGVFFGEQASERRPDLVVLDLMLPEVDGLEVCRRLRADPLARNVPVVMLTAKGDEQDRITGLELGADDYVTKPFSPRELVLRIQSVLRRSAAQGGAQDSTAAVPELLRAGDLTLDPGARRAHRAGRELTLTLREFDLLAFLLQHPGTAFGREELMHKVWGWDFGDMSTVTVHVRRLREKVEDDAAAPKLITTVWGVGYRFDPAGEFTTESTNEGTEAAAAAAAAGEAEA